MSSKLAMITFLTGGSGDVDPGYGQEIGGHPSHGLPGQGINYPSHGLPGGGGYPIQLPVFPFDPSGHPDNSLPGQSGRPDNSLPDSGNRPSNELPQQPVIWPPRPGQRFMVKWIACLGLALVPDNSLPETPEPK